jgi:hypothetical protein
MPNTSANVLKEATELHVKAIRNLANEKTSPRYFSMFAG